MNGWTNIWEMLGISYTTDIDEIKRAYAGRAKDCHPEEHPEEFRRLQNAYKTAVKIAKARKAYEKAVKESGEKRPGDKESEESESEERESEDKETGEKGSKEKESEDREPEESGTDNGTGVTEEEVLAAKKALAEMIQTWMYAESVTKKDGSQEETPGSALDFFESQPVSGFSPHFDYSELQDEEIRRKQQAKEDLRKEILYLIWNPYARNNVRIWEFFLRGHGRMELFWDPEFRADFVRLLYQERFAGWHRDQILYFWDFLTEFKLAGESAPELQMRQWDWLLENAGRGRELLDSPCITSEEQQNYSAINFNNRSKIAVLHGELAKTKEEQYLAWYMAYAKKNEDRLRTLYREWVILREQRFEHSDAESIEIRSLYMIWNPYVRNNIDMWKCFLNGKRTRELFGDPDFRLMFARQVCRARFAGWEREQIAYLWQYLADFEPDGKLPGDFPGEEWDEIFRSAPKGGRTAVFSFLTRKEKAAYDNLFTGKAFEGADPESGRSFEEQYLDWYFKYAEENGPQLASGYDKWLSIRKRLNHFGRLLRALPVMAAVILVLVWEVNIYKPYENNLKRYQKTHEQFQEEEETQKEAYWEETRKQAQEAFQEIQGLLEEWGIRYDFIQDQTDFE